MAPAMTARTELSGTSLAWTKAIERFRAQIEVTRSSSTAQVYERGVRMFMVWLGAREFAAGLPSGTLQDFAIWGLRDGKSISSMQVYVSGVRKFCLWLEHGGAHSPNFGPVEWPKHSLPPPEVLLPNALEQFLGWVKANVNEPYRTAMLMSPYCGLRISELVKLKMADVAPAGNGLLVTVRGKGNKYRHVPVLLAFAPILRSYLRGWRDESKRARSGWLFPSATKPSKALDRRSLTEKFTEAARALNTPLTAHKMRRQYATSLYKSGVPLATISKALGHADARTTSERYLAMTGADLVEAVRKVKL